MDLGYIANLALGLALLALGLGFAIRTHGATRALGIFLILVGINYLTDAIGPFETRAGVDPTFTYALKQLSSFFDPVALVMFAAMATGRKTWPIVLPFAGLATFLTVALVANVPESRWIALVNVAIAYLLAFALIAAELLATLTQKQRDQFVLLFVCFGLVCLPRVSYVYTDLGLVRGSVQRASFGTLWLEFSLLASFVLLWSMMRARASPEVWPTARRALVSLAWLLWVLMMTWLLRFVRVINEPAFALLYSMRWFLFLGVFVSGVKWHPELVGMSPRLVRVFRRVYVVLLGMLGVAFSASLVAAVVDAPPFVAVLAGLAIVSVAFSAVAALRYARLAPDEMAWRRTSIYRAHLLMGTQRRELAALRQHLGLSAHEADEWEKLATLELNAAKAGPRPGALFLGRYAVTQVTGRGAFGFVFRAVDEVDGTDVVLKELRDEWQANPQAIERFRREAEVLLRVEHPNLVRLRSIEPAPSGFVLVLDAVPGETLRSRLERAPLSSTEAARVGRDVLAALAALHRANICHRDVKPENVMLRPDGRAVLLDLGAAADRDKGTRIWSDGRAGTPRYMAPEQEQGKEATPASDIFALGVVLREAMHDVPTRWAPALTRATDPDPKRRFATAEAFRAALPK